MDTQTVIPGGVAEVSWGRLLFDCYIRECRYSSQFCQIFYEKSFAARVKMNIRQENFYGRSSNA